jgi:hypothetical protein
VNKRSASGVEAMARILSKRRRVIEDSEDDYVEEAEEVEEDEEDEEDEGDEEVEEGEAGEEIEEIEVLGEYKVIEYFADDDDEADAGDDILVKFNSDQRLLTEFFSSDEELEGATAANNDWAGKGVYQLHRQEDASRCGQR